MLNLNLGLSGPREGRGSAELQFVTPLVLQTWNKAPRD